MTGSSVVEYRCCRCSHGCRPDLRFPCGQPFRGLLASADAVAAPAHLDAEVLSAVGRLRRAGYLTRADERVQAVATFGATRWPLQPLLLSAWALVDRIATRDALYVALAASLDGVLVTTDERLRRAAAGIVAVANPDASTTDP